MSNAHIQITADIVSAYVSKNSVRPEDVAGLMRDVHCKLAELVAGKAGTPVAAKLEPSVPIKKTITPGYLVSLEDGRHYKTLRRHLAKRGLTPDAYRTKWGLPADYPMVAKDYAERRSALARSIGLGRKPVVADPGDQAQAIADDLVDVIAEDVIGNVAPDHGEPPAAATEAADASSPKKRGRTAKAKGMVTPHPKPRDRAKAKKPAREEAEAVS